MKRFVTASILSILMLCSAIPASACTQGIINLKLPGSWFSAQGNRVVTLYYWGNSWSVQDYSEPAAGMKYMAAPQLLERLQQEGLFELGVVRGDGVFSVETYPHKFRTHPQGRVPTAEELRTIQRAKKIIVEELKTAGVL